MTFEDWQTVIEPKVQGTWNLHNVFKDSQHSLDFFLLFSSISGLIGQWGQTNYSAANCFLDSFSTFLRAQNVAGSTLQIGPVEDVGYVSRTRWVLDYFHATSAHLLTEIDVLEALQLMIRGRNYSSSQDQYISEHQLGLGMRSALPLSAPNNRTTGKRDPRVALYRNLESGHAASTGAGNDVLRDFVGQAATDPTVLDTEESAVFLGTQIGKTLCGFMMRSEDSLDVSAAPASLGVDSLVGIELRNWFQQSFACELTILDILSAASLVDLGKLTGGLLKKKYAIEDDSRAD